jgi:SAM-dependent methyltransferase
MTARNQDERGASADRLDSPEAPGTLLNLGCGSDSHPAFVNVDLIPGPGVIGHDLRRGIPFPDATYDLVYQSTMLSHLRPADALSLTRECCRVLKPGGVLRIVTEDLEQMCRIYLEKLEAAWNGDRQSSHDYDWMLLELYDQASREFPGGRIAAYLRQNPLPNEEFVYARIGSPGRNMVTSQRAMLHARSAPVPLPRRALSTLPRRLLGRARRLIVDTLLGPGAMDAFDVGRFRLTSGQVSYRMYDRYSLRELFRTAGFSEITLQDHRRSRYAAWSSVNLDMTPSGDVARPHTLVMEGIRPF